MSEGSSPNSSGQTFDLSKFLASEPASNMIHGASRLSGVKHTIPTRDASSSLEISEFQRDPFEMSSGVK